jgi:hypothetical protein
MPVGTGDKIDYRTSEVSGSIKSWLTPEPCGQPKIVAFISSSDNLGTELLSGVAAAISALDKQVALVDLAPANGKTPSVGEALPPGVRVLHIDGDSETGDDWAAGDFGMLQAMGDVADYLLVDLPFRPTPFARSVLSGCDLVIVAGSCKIEYLCEAENIVKVLLFLGIAAEKVAGVLVDPEGILSSASLAGIKPYLESSLGIEMAGVVSFGDGPGSQLDRDIEQLVQYIK